MKNKKVEKKLVKLKRRKISCVKTMQNLKITEVLQLANESRRLLTQIKDISDDIEKINDEVKVVLMLMDQHERVAIVQDETNTFRVYHVNPELREQIIQEVENENDVDEEDSDWEDIDSFEIDQIESWQDFHNIFGTLTQFARQVAKDLEELADQVQKNADMIAKATENLESIVEIMVEEFNAPADELNPMANRARVLDEQTKIFEKLLQDLNSLRTLFPKDDVESASSTTNEEIRPTTNEENRPFPNAWP